MSKFYRNGDLVRLGDKRAPVIATWGVSQLLVGYQGLLHPWSLKAVVPVSLVRTYPSSASGAGEEQ